MTTGHSYRTRSVENVLEECARVKRLFPDMKELFFDDDTFTADPKRAVEIARGLGKLGHHLVHQLARQRRPRDAAAS